MKKLTLAAVIVTVACMLLSFSQTNNSFQGVITYYVTFDGDSAAGMPMSLVPNSTMKIYIKNNMWRVESKFGNYCTIQLYNGTSTIPISLFNTMGQHFMWVPDSAHPAVAATIPPFQYLNNTKQIMGYNCNEAIATLSDMNGQTYTADIYYTAQLPYNAEIQKLAGLKGFPLSFSLKENGKSFTRTASVVTPQALPDSLFQVSSYYVKATTAQMQQALASAMSGSH